MSIRKIVLKSAMMVGATASAVVLVMATPASAVTYGYGPWYDASKGAKVYFEKRGDHIKVCDVKSDGRKATVNVYDTTMDNYLFTLTDTKNDGKCKYSSAASGGKYNLPEKHWYKFVVGKGTYVEHDKAYNIYNDR